MKTKTLVLMVVAIGCGLAASYMTSRVIADRQSDQVDEKVTVLVARKNLTLGTHIKEPEQLFEEKQFTKGEEPKKAIKSFEQIKDRRLNKPLSAEQFLTPEDLIDKDQDGLSGVMKKGSRAVGLKMDVERSGGGFVLPHSRVDIICVNTRNANEITSRIILQNILVLAVDLQTVRPEDKPGIVPATVTVEVTPQEAETLALAKEMGTLQLILRSFGDEDNVRTAGATPKNLAKQGAVDRQDESSGGSEGVLGGAPLAKIPDVPAKPVPAVAEVKAPEAKIHTLTIYNGDAVTKAIYTEEVNGKGSTHVESTQPVAHPDKKPAPTVTAPKEVSLDDLNKVNSALNGLKK